MFLIFTLSFFIGAWRRQILPWVFFGMLFAIVFRLSVPPPIF